MSVSPGRVGVPIPMSPPRVCNSVSHVPRVHRVRVHCPCPNPAGVHVPSSCPPPRVPSCHTVSISAPWCPSPCSRSCPCVPPSCPCVPFVSVSMYAQPRCVHVHLSHPCPSVPRVCGHPLVCPCLSILSNPCPSMTILSPSPRVTAPLSPPHRVRVHPVTSVSLCVPRVPLCPPLPHPPLHVRVHPFMSVFTLSCPCPCPLPRVRVHPATCPLPASPVSVSTPSCPSVTTVSCPLVSLPF